MSASKARSRLTSRGWNKRIRWGVSALIALCLLTAYWAYQSFQPPVGKSGTVDFRIRPGESVRGIAQELEQSGLVRNALVFRLYVSYRHAAGTFKAGQYQIVRGSGIPEIISQLSNGRVVDSSVPVTIPEGYTAVQIAERLQMEHVCTVSDFMQEVSTGRFTEPFLQQVQANPHVKYRLEGYLFPDTYRFSRGEPAHQVIDEMLSDFQGHLDALGWTVPNAGGQNLSQVITEASLVEREARVNAERPIIASVIDNRLQHSMKLQIDATIEYVLGHKNVLLDKDLKVADPYNTYLYTGLPPGPIASPGTASIKAVLHPAKTSYFYYVVKNNGSGEHYFAKTFTEQLHNEALSQENLKKAP